MLLLADFLPFALPTPWWGGADEAGWREGLQNEGGSSGLLRGSPEVRQDQGMEPKSQRELPSWSRPHARARGTGTGAFPPPSLPLRRWEGNWVSQLSPAAGWEGEGAALQLPPDQQGLVWGEGEEGGLWAHPTLTPVPDGVSELEGPSPCSPELPLCRRHLNECPPLGLLPRNTLTPGAAARRPPSRPCPPLGGSTPSAAGSPSASQGTQIIHR